MIDRLTLHNSLQDIADYFRECRKNAAPGSSAEVRFDVYVSAMVDVDKQLKEQDAEIHRLNRELDAMNRLSEMQMEALQEAEHDRTD